MTDLTRGINDRFTSERTVGGFPVWSPDGSRIAFRFGQDLFQKPSSGGGDAERLSKAETQDSPTSWSPDGRFLLFTTIGLNSLFDIKVLTIDAGHRVSPFLKTQYNESQATFSPDGRWVAYTSTESGRNEVYVRPFTPPGAEPTIEGKWPVSKEGGNAPVWREDGRELFLPIRVRRPHGRGHHIDGDDVPGRDPEAAFCDAISPVERDRGRQAVPRLDATASGRTRCQSRST